VEALRTACRHPLFSRGLVDSETLAKEREYPSPALMAKKFLAAYAAAVTARR